MSGEVEVGVPPASPPSTTVSGAGSADSDMEWGLVTRAGAGGSAGADCGVGAGAGTRAAGAAAGLAFGASDEALATLLAGAAISAGSKGSKRAPQGMQ